MGYLTDGKPLSWVETRKKRDLVYVQATAYILNTFKSHKDRRDDPFLWGDEIEFQVVYLDTVLKRPYLSIRAHDALFALMKEAPSQWHPEYARWMLEATPINPYTFSPAALAWECEADIRSRRIMAKKFLTANEVIFPLTSFPLLGSPNCLKDGSKEVKVDTPHSRSLYLPDAAISSHPRFATLTSNIRERRGNVSVDIKLPLFNINAITSENIPSVHLDAMGFGMGLSCLQTTIQCPNLKMATVLYDKLAVLAPIMIAFTASTPALKARLLDIDARWDIISAAVDDRSPEEHALNIPSKSRYASISTYLSTSSSTLNNIPLPINIRVYDSLIRSGEVDMALARHFGYLFIRDPLVLYNEKEDEQNLEALFESIQSTNWNTVRLKLPSDSLELYSWRVEFRPMEAQITEWESAAILAFIQLLSKAILDGEPDIFGLIPISLLDENIKNCQTRDALRITKFHWRWKENDQIELLSLDEIINGPNGLLSIVQKKLMDFNLYNSNEVSHISPDKSKDAIDRIGQYLDYIKDRASGKIPTPARMIREFIMKHPSYLNDSVVPVDTAYDLLQKLAMHAELNIPFI